MHWPYSHARTPAAKSIRKSSFLTVVVADFFRCLRIPSAAPRRTGSCPTLLRVDPRYLCVTSLFIRTSSLECSALSQGARGRSEHSEIARDLRCCLSTFYEAAGIADSAVSDDLRPPTEILAGVAALRDGVDHTFSFDFVFHLSECRHDREQHGPHWCRCVDVAAAQVEYAEARSAAVEFLDEREHVLCRSAQPDQGRDNEGVAVLECVERTVELGP